MQGTSNVDGMASTKDGHYYSIFTDVRPTLQTNI